MAVVIGKNGFIGSHLAKRLGEVSEYPDKNTDVIYDFGSPTHQYWNDYCTTSAIQRIMTLAPLCKANDILYVFPSSALIYEKETPFTQSKMACEELLRAYNMKHLIVRLWPMWGDEEVSKEENSSVIDIWMRDMKEGKRPVVYGDGKQKRGFIHVDKVVEDLIGLVKNGQEGTTLIKGNPISFNKIIKNINEEFRTDLKPKYVKAPEGYSLKSPNP